MILCGISSAVVFQLLNEMSNIVTCYRLRVCRNPILPWHKLSPEKLAKAKFEKELEFERRESLLIAKAGTVKSRLNAAAGFNRPRGRPRRNLLGGKKYGSKLPPLLKIPKVSATGEEDSVSKRLKEKVCLLTKYHFLLGICHF